MKYLLVKIIAEFDYSDYGNDSDSSSLFFEGCFEIENSDFSLSVKYEDRDVVDFTLSLDSASSGLHDLIERLVRVLVADGYATWFDQMREDSNRAENESSANAQCEADRI